MTILAIDYGKKKIGLAVSDETEIIASRISGLFVRNRSEGLDKLVKKIEEIRPSKIVFGFSENYTQGGDFELSEVRTFATELEKLLKDLSKESFGNSCLIEFWDESFSSYNAEIGRSRNFQKHKSDSEAARIILQEYLDNMNS